MNKPNYMELKYNDYNNLPLKVFNKITGITTTDEVDYEITLLSYLCDCNEEDILNLSLTDYQTIRKEAQFIASFPDIKGTVTDKIRIKDNRYYVCKDLSQITAAQYIDYQSYLKADDKKYEYLLSCFIIPVGKTYCEGYNVDDVIKDIMELDIVSVLNICFFFLNLFLTSTKALVHYWESQMKKMMKKEKDKEMKKKFQETLNQIRLMRSGLGY